ncbi:MAG: 3'-5' exonuclease [Bacteroidetes bacterium SW_9_63_38]|nr:MAG: 3'-5' exonuclease [Bacteroidetes bacterium SW_9_63_38]
MTCLASPSHVGIAPVQPDRPLRTVPLIFFDLETTALRPDRGGRIREIAVVDQNGIRFDWKSDHDAPSDQAVARRLPRLLDVLEDRVVVGHNLSFDFRFVTYEAERLGHPGLDLRYVDTLGLARALLDAPDDYSLGPLLAQFDAAPDEALHTAVGDALATRTLFWHLVDTGGLTTLADVGVKRLRWHG